jgi:hypothetical protein
MKKFLLLFIAVTFLCSLTSCYEEETGMTQVPLEGTEWVTTSLLVTSCDNPDNDKSQRMMTCSNVDCETLLMQDGSLIITTISEGQTTTVRCTYSMSGNVITACYIEDPDDEFIILYRIINNVLTLDYTDVRGCDILQTFIPLADS